MHIAVAGVDFSAVPLNLTFTSESTTKSVNISILDDNLVEKHEVIHLALTTLTPNVILIDHDRAQIEIIDNDCKRIVLSSYFFRY